MSLPPIEILKAGRSFCENCKEC